MRWLWLLLSCVNRGGGREKVKAWRKEQETKSYVQPGKARDAAGTCRGTVTVTGEPGQE